MKTLIILCFLIGAYSCKKSNSLPAPEVGYNEIWIGNGGRATGKDVLIISPGKSTWIIETTDFVIVKTK